MTNKPSLHVRPDADTIDLLKQVQARLADQGIELSIPLVAAMALKKGAQLLSAQGSTKTKRSK